MPLPAGINIPLTYEHLLLIENAARYTKCVNYAALTLMFYDMLLTSVDEVKYIWKARWTLVKVIFLLSRYISPIIIIGNVYALSGLARDLTDHSCQRWTLAANTFEQLFVAIITLIVILRMHAIWGASERTLYFLLAIWVSVTCASIGMLVNTFFLHRRFIYFEDRLNICFAFIPNLWQLWLPDVILHGFLVCFLIYKAVATPRAAQTPMLAILTKDGIVYYSVTFAALLWATLMWRAASYVYLGIPLYSTWMFLQVAMSRLLLSIKSTQAVYLHRPNHPNARLPPATDMENAKDSAQDVTVTTVKPSKVKFASTPSEKPRPTHHTQPSQSSYNTNRTLSPTKQLTSFFEMSKPKGWRRSRSGSGNSDPNYIPYHHPYGHRDSSAASTHSNSSTDWFWWIGAGGASRRPSTPSDAARTSFGDDAGANPYDYMRGTQSQSHHRYDSWL